MALPFETSDMILFKEQGEHVNYRHVEVNDQRASKFKCSFLFNWDVGLTDKRGGGWLQISSRTVSSRVMVIIIYMFPGWVRSSDTIGIGFPVEKYVCITAEAGL